MTCGEACVTCLCVRLPRRVILSILARSLLVQSAWNFKGMQNIGFTYVLAPGLRHLLGDRADEAVRRSIAFFNTQPYMAPTLAGVCLHLYEKGEEDKIRKFIPSLSGSLAALGDTFFWAKLKPILALVLVTCALSGAYLGMVLALIAYNAAHLWIMTWGFFKGYRHGIEGALVVGRTISVDSTHHLGLVMAFIAGITLGITVLGRIGPQAFLGPSVGPLAAVSTAIALFAAYAAFRWLRLDILWFIYGVFTLSVIWTMLK